MKKKTSFFKKIASVVFSFALLASVMGNWTIDQIPKAEASSITISMSTSNCTAGSSRSFSLFWLSFTNGPYTITVNVSGTGSIISVSGFSGSGASATKTGHPSNTGGSTSGGILCGPGAGSVLVTATISNASNVVEASDSESFTVVNLQKPTITPLSPSNGETVITHSDAAGTQNVDYTVTVDDGDSSVTQTSSIALVSCPAGWSIFGSTSGSNTWTTTIRRVYNQDGPKPQETCNVKATDPEGDSLTNAALKFTASNAAPVISVTWGPCGAFTDFSQIPEGHPGCSATGSLTINDADDDGPFNVSISPGSTNPTFGGLGAPLAEGGPHVVTMTLTSGWVGGVFSYSAPDIHGAVGYSNSFQVGPVGDSKRGPRGEFVNDQTQVQDPGTGTSTTATATETHASGPACKETWKEIGEELTENPSPRPSAPTPTNSGNAIEGDGFSQNGGDSADKITSNFDA